MIKSKSQRSIILAFLMVSLVQCNNTQLSPTLKFQPNDPFKNEMVKSETFDVDAKKDTVITGYEGTVLVLPRGCFKNAKGDIVTEIVKIELAEALILDNMLLSNLTTNSNGQPLETDGMIYFNVTSNGEQVTVNPDIPV